jgi:hypothetical protein
VLAPVMTTNHLRTGAYLVTVSHIRTPGNVQHPQQY